MRFTPNKLPGMILIEPEVFEDDRGAFWESYQKELFVKNGIPDEFVQDNQSFSAKGTLRGLHWQVEPMAQAKLVRVVQGEVFDVVVDVRKGTPTFGQWTAERLSAKNRASLYIPAGFAHGFLALQAGTEVLYKVTKVYSPEHERGLRWDDPALGIQWPDLGQKYLVSDRDCAHPSFRALQENR